LLVETASRLEPLDVGLARATYLDAIGAATIAGTLGDGLDVTDVARAARAAPRTAGPPSAADLLLEGLVALFLDGYGTAIGPLRDALRAFRREQERDVNPLEASSTSDVLATLASRVAIEVWDEESALAISTHQVERARDAGALTALPVGLTSLAGLRVHAGDFSAAQEMLREAEAITGATGNVRPGWGGLVLAAWRGDARQATSLIEASIEDAQVRGEGWQLTAARYASAVLDNGRGRYAAARESAMGACWEGEQGFAALALPELIEAAIRSNREEIAAEGVRRLSERARLGGTAWALGVEARSRALVSQGAAADALYQEAIAHLGASVAVPQLARTHLLYGEWQRREKRRVEAREQLRLAYEIFARIGAAGFADRAQRELEATGEHARRRSVETIDDLTAQESQIARLAGKGFSNPEIGSQLFISPRTVEYHLRKIFSKLQISSRHEIARALDRRAGE
jgi:DNA-binding CsgD family transcriptional regulator